MQIKLLKSDQKNKLIFFFTLKWLTEWRVATRSVQKGENPDFVESPR